MKTLGFIILGMAAAGLLVLMVFGLVKAWPFGLPGLLVLAGMALLLGHVLKSRAANKEDDYYIKNVHQ